MFHGRINITWQLILKKRQGTEINKNCCEFSSMGGWEDCGISWGYREKTYLEFHFRQEEFEVSMECFGRNPDLQYEREMALRFRLQDHLHQGESEVVEFGEILEQERKEGKSLLWGVRSSMKVTLGLGSDRPEFDSNSTTYPV